MPENIIQIDQNLLETRLDRLITEKMTQILNAMLDAEADEITGAARYELAGGQKAYRGRPHYERKLTARRQARLMPKLKGALFESAVIERYRRHPSESVEILIDMYLAGVSTARSTASIIAVGDRMPSPDISDKLKGSTGRSTSGAQAVGIRIPVRVRGRRVAQSAHGAGIEGGVWSPSGIARRGIARSSASRREHEEDSAS